MRLARAAAAGFFVALVGCRSHTSAESEGDVGLLDRVAVALHFKARGDSLGDSRAIPHYTTRAFTTDERDLLREAFGVDDPAKLYLADSTEDGLLKYDTKIKRCLDCYVNTYGIGFVSVRRAGETWEQAEQRVHAMKRRDFPPTALIESISLSLLDPDVRGKFERMLADAKTAGFNVHVVATYRSPEREAYLMAQSIGQRARTWTLTSMHSYGRAIDIIVNDGNIRRPKTRAAWAEFRKWLVAYDDHEFRLLGQPGRSWDWRHIEMPSESIGFHSIEAALAAAQRCTAPGGSAADCTFHPNLPK